MNWNSRNFGAVRWVALLIAAFVAGASASAGTLYSWKTDDGTQAYTNDKKRIPAKYKGQVETSKFQAMNSYKRLTPGPKSDLAPYSERIVERLEVLRSAGEPALASSGGGVSGGFVKVNINAGSDGRGSGAEVQIPVGAGSDPDWEPVTIEHVRVMGTKGHSSSRHVQVVRQGDKVLAVIKGRNTNTKLPGRHLQDGDFGTNSVD
jgi:hypothetical protein